MVNLVPLTREHIVAALGNGVDDAAVAELIATGATAEEFAEAIAWVGNDEPLYGDGRPLATGRVARLVEILSNIDGDADEDERPLVDIQS